MPPVREARLRPRYAEIWNAQGTLPVKVQQGSILSDVTQVTRIESLARPLCGVVIPNAGPRDSPYNGLLVSLTSRSRPPT
jgi:hypothetical protein